MNSRDTNKSYRKGLLLIILLLIFLISCFLLGYRLGKINTPKSNVDPDIFEINGGNSNNNTTPDNNNTTNDDTISSDNNNNNSSQSNNNQSSTSANSSSNTNSNNNSNNSVVIDNNNNTSSNVVSKDEDFNLIVKDNHINWNSAEKLDIFKNLYFNNQSIIAPGVSSNYDFVIKNNTTYTLSYDIKMVETNDYNINMKYRLKKNNEYIIGSNDTWVDASKLNLDNQILKSTNSDSYSLEWKWFDGDNDNEIGKIDGADYSLSISISAEDSEA